MGYKGSEIPTLAILSNISEHSPELQLVMLIHVSHYQI